LSGGLRRWQPWIGLAAFALAAFLVHRALRHYSMSEILASLRAIPLRHLALGAAFTAGSYFCLTWFDTLAVRYAGGDLPYRKIALASFTSLSIGHTLGFAALSSGAIRYRFYTGWGLPPGDIGRIILFCAMTVALGMAATAGLASLIQPALVAEVFGVAPAIVVAVGVLLLLAVLLYLALAAFVHRPVRIGHFALPVPRLGLALGQVAAGTTDFLLVSAVLHQMLSATTAIGYFPVAAIYVPANVAGIVTHVPGGLGVIEAVVLSLVPGANVIGALVAFRALYYLAPFVVGCVVLALSEIVRRQRTAAPTRASRCS
jgi:glycosyltransferase 2 family protein